MGRIKLECVLKNQDGDNSTIKATLHIMPGAIEIGFEGYGEHGAEDGEGRPIIIELYKGHPRIVVFGNINSEAPSKIVTLMDDAKESLRDIKPG